MTLLSWLINNLQILIIGHLSATYILAFASTICWSETNNQMMTRILSSYGALNDEYPFFYKAYAPTEHEMHLTPKG